MKRLLLAAVTLSLLAVAVGLSGSPPAPSGALQVQVEDRNPWTNLRINNDPEDFQFAIVSDRTGGHRARVFSRAVDQLNLLQPEFVVSVGDLIEGGKEDPERLAAEWREFQGYVCRLQMPFFYAPGNHDISNLFQEKLWQEKFGRRYYHFLYKNVLFLVLCSEDPPKTSSMSKYQIAYIQKTLEENAGVRWTFVFLHKPLWTHSDLEKNGWLDVEKLLAGRPYTVFCGHVHRYQKFVRNGRNYYQLATTGGGSRMRGPRYGEVDQVAWVTMKKTGPVLANILLDGVYGEDLTLPVSEEAGIAREQRPTQPVRGRVYFEGTPAAGATVAFHLRSADGKRLTRAGDALVESDGSFVLSTYTPWDGAPEGEYVVTVTQGGPMSPGDSTPRANRLPARYTRPETSGLAVTVHRGQNEFMFDLKPAAAEPKPVEKK
jgi:hypothetical protein